MGVEVGERKSVVVGQVGGGGGGGCGVGFSFAAAHGLPGFPGRGCGCVVVV